MKKKIAYISSDWLFDVDKTLFSQMSKDYDLYYYVYSDLISPRWKGEDMHRIASEANVNIKIIDAKHKELSPLSVLEYIDLAREINKINPAIIVKVVQNFYWSLVFKIMCKAPVIYCLHDVEVHSGTHHALIREFFTRFSIALHRHFIVYSNFQYELFNKKYPGKDVKVIPMSVKNFGDSQERYPNINDEIRLLFFGRIEYHKGLDLLIEALERLYASNEKSKKIKLSICGKGGYWSECEKLLKSKSQYNIQVRYIGNDEVASLMSSHHFLVLPYRDTTQSGPLMIAAYYGLPLFAYNHASFKEIYNSDAAIFFTDIDEGVSKLADLSAEKYDGIRKKTSLLKDEYGEMNIYLKYKSFFEEIL